MNILARIKALFFDRTYNDVWGDMPLQAEETMRTGGGVTNTSHDPVGNGLPGQGLVSGVSYESASAPVANYSDTNT